MVNVVFLHGIGAGCDALGWQAALNTVLDALGYPALDAEHVFAPQYSHLLDQEPSPQCPLPPQTATKLADADADRERWEYERRQASLLRLLEVEGRHGDAFKRSERLPQLGLTILPHARRYVGNEGLRGCVLQAVLEKLPTTGEVVFVGHSLGSLVAIDLLDHLPPKLVVRRLVTIGSPAGHVIMHGKGERLLKTFPLSRVRSWLNVWSVYDPVPYGRCLASLFPEALDFRITLKFGDHGAEKYLGDRAVGIAIGEAVFGSLTRDIALRPMGVERPLDDNERLILAMLTYGHQLADAIAEDRQKQSRFQAALRERQIAVITALEQAHHRKNRSMPARLADLADGRRPEPAELFDHVGLLVDVLLFVASNNIVAPFEIEVSPEHRRKALESLARSLGSNSNYGTRVFESLTEARNVVNPRVIVSLKTLTMAGVGLSLLVAGPVGLVLAVPTGLGGGAAIVAALAAFGPGGMLGGLLTAGTLTAAGGGAVAAALASASASAEAVESVVVQRLATAIARDKLKVGYDPTPWFALCELEEQIAYQLQRIETFSDKKCHGLQRLRRKESAVQRAIQHMVDKQLIHTLGT